MLARLPETTKLPKTKGSVIETTLSNIPKHFPHTTVCRIDQTDLIDHLKAINEPYLTCAPSSSFLGDSISAAVKQTSAWQGWVICLADMPWVTSTTYTEVINSITNTSIAIPTVIANGQLLRGNPVGFGKAYEHQLMSLAGKTGGKEITNQNSSHIHFVETKDRGILLDIDYPDDIKLNPM